MHVDFPAMSVVELVQIAGYYKLKLPGDAEMPVIVEKSELLSRFSFAWFIVNRCWLFLKCNMYLQSSWFQATCGNFSHHSSLKSGNAWSECEQKKYY